jgi:hypothetical protein
VRVLVNARRQLQLERCKIFFCEGASGVQLHALDMSRKLKESRGRELTQRGLQKLIDKLTKLRAADLKNMAIVFTQSTTRSGTSRAHSPQGVSRTSPFQAACQ